MQKKKVSISKIVSVFVFLSLLFSVVFIIIRIHFAPGEAPPDDPQVKVKSDYSLMLIQCVLGVIVWTLPSLFRRRFNIVLPNSFLMMYFIFLYCAIYLGEVRNFYFVVPQWDTILHAFSGAMLGALGFSVVLLLNDTKKALIHLSPLFVSIFAFCFAVTLGVFWEIYEFTFDGLLGLNMQKFMLEDKTPLLGRMALMDTMKDLIVDVVGAFAISLLGFLMMRKKPSWLLNFDIKKQTE
ncbi:hypothetical protein K7I13_12330 [Brucepastera parasyntrophica]|uniref:hypothetical protein n=1 Tax=Brucepastera parasyntrophica TaxID=2880008 RepID=UPI00210C5804|nr:hypothetical protein [Brucepastera parasyntrophica]ULQ59269.1 hypothetical protein K7I13_12330 [Brucepastera parasyntrophica]